jgi:hypothetical protein
MTHTTEIQTIRNEMAIKGLRNCTPVEIDTVLYHFYGLQSQAQAAYEQADRSVAELRMQISKVLDGEKVRGINTPADGVRLSQRLDTQFATMQRLESQRDALLDEAAPYERQYNRRQWSRYFLVQNDNGHIHSSMGCSTCNREGIATRFGWLVELSGKAEADVTDEVGPNACTVCYPWAETIREEAEKGARKARQDEKAAKDAEKARIAAEKGITTPEGLPLNVGNHGFPDIAKTLRTAEIAATDSLVDLVTIQREALDPEYAFLFQNGRTVEVRTMEITLRAWYLLRSIAAKKGQTFEETFQVHEAKAQAKVRKNDREWAKDFRNPNRSK